MYIGNSKLNAIEASEYYVQQIYGESRKILASSIENVGTGMRFRLADGIRWYLTTLEPYGWEVREEPTEEGEPCDKP